MFCFFFRTLLRVSVGGWSLAGPEPDDRQLRPRGDLESPKVDLVVQLELAFSRSDRRRTRFLSEILFSVLCLLSNLVWGRRPSRTDTQNHKLRSYGSWFLSSVELPSSWSESRRRTVISSQCIYAPLNLWKIQGWADETEHKSCWVISPLTLKWADTRY